MFKIGNKVIVIPDQVNVKIQDDQILVKGPKGEIAKTFRNEISFLMEKNLIYVKLNSTSKFVRALHGLYRNLLFNMIKGVTEGFQKKLLLNGVGYRVQLINNELKFSLGYSHPIILKIPEKITAEVLDNGKVLILKSFDNEFLGNIASKIRQFRVPEPYKKKGIKYDNEIIIGKAGKSSKK